jgi:phosphoglycolate phosphatase
MVRKLYIGDAKRNLEGGDYAGIPFIHAKYGFGRVDNPQYSISNVAKIPELIRRIL